MAKKQSQTKPIQSQTKPIKANQSQSVRPLDVGEELPDCSKPPGADSIRRKLGNFPQIVPEYFDIR
ncbi:MAG: hypothetical protein A2Z38_04990 [Planctomycetes bacterium RBG_19FT_COMBO_48_8]|nr:MAG: hypothetical protein A2Z38_04990 [Planctomycetes bacterium RBG_19FT_COMBO_48_8]